MNSHTALLKDLCTICLQGLFRVINNLMSMDSICGLLSITTGDNFNCSVRSYKQVINAFFDLLTIAIYIYNASYAIQ